MNGYAILMYVFGFLILLSGIFVFTGHDQLLTRGYYKKASKSHLRYIGRTIMIISLSPVLSGLSTLFIDEENIWIPLVVLVGSMILGFFISISFKKKVDEE